MAPLPSLIVGHFLGEKSVSQTVTRDAGSVSGCLLLSVRGDGCRLSREKGEGRKEILAITVLEAGMVVHPGNANCLEEEAERAKSAASLGYKLRPCLNK